MPSMATRDWRSSWNTFVSPLAGIWLGSLLSSCLGSMAVPVCPEELPIWDSVHDSGAQQEAKSDCHAQPPSLPSPPVPCSIMLNIISSQNWFHLMLDFTSCAQEKLCVSQSSSETHDPFGCLITKQAPPPHSWTRYFLMHRGEILPPKYVFMK